MLPSVKKSGSFRPPPLPQTPPAVQAPPRAGSLGRVKAFVKIQQMRARERARRAWAGVKRRPILSVLAAIVLAAAAVGAVGFATDSLPDLDEVVPDVDIELFPRSSLKDASAKAREHPRDAAAQRDYGHALWDAKKRHAAVARYARALAIDREAADERMAANLVASFGGRDQRKAEALISRNKLTGAERGLEALVSSRSQRVRWGAVRTLDKLDKGSRANWEKASLLDLEESDCDVRRAAVAKLGEIGSRRALKALASARADDEKTGGWFSGRCLGDRLDDAEQKIKARR